jgi:AcrR family transcriptional regulator
MVTPLIMITERNRGETEKRILEAVGRIVESDGFEKVGINAVANEAGVSKMLIYRYFSSIDGLLAAYIKQNDYWLNISLELPLEKGMLIPYVVQVYKAQIFQLRDNIVMRRLLRWELANNNDLISDIRAKREENGMSLIKIVSNLSGKPVKEIAEMASLLSASITYLALLSDIYPVYNGLDIADDKGWSDLIEGIEKIIKNFTIYVTLW